MLRYREIQRGMPDKGELKDSNTFRMTINILQGGDCSELMKSFMECAQAHEKDN